MPYGDIETLSRYAGAPLVMPARYEWQHGWVPSAHPILSPEAIVRTDGKSRFRRAQLYLVAQQDHADALESYDYPYVRAIGLPISYVSEAKINRLRDSLLLVPSHSSSESRLREDTFADVLAAAAKYAGHYARLAVLIYGQDISRPTIASFQKFGVQVLRGAEINDSSSLGRIAQIFQQYETVHSFSLGSNVAYAAHFGAQISVSLPPVREGLSEPARSVFTGVYYRNCLACAWAAHEFSRLAPENPDLRFLFREPPEATTAQEWGSNEIGFNNRMSADKVRELFGGQSLVSGGANWVTKLSQQSTTLKPWNHALRQVRWLLILLRWLVSLGLSSVSAKSLWIPQSLIVRILRAAVAFLDYATASRLRGLRIETLSEPLDDHRRIRVSLAKGRLVAVVSREGQDKLRILLLEGILEGYEEFPCESVEVGDITLLWESSAGLGFVGR